MRKLTLISLLLCAGLVFSACTKRNNDISGKKRIITTIFPIYDWTRILMNQGFNENVLINEVVKSGFDIHTFAPSQADIIQIQNADLIICSNLSSLEIPETNGKVLNLTEVLKEQLPDEDFSDEHIWVSLKNAIICCNAITQALCQLDSENSETYIRINKEYTEQLQDLDFNFSNSVENAKNKTIILADRFPFYYLAKDYNLNFYTLSSNCTKSSVLDSTKINNFAKKLDDLNCNSIFVTETSDKKEARSIISASNNPKCDTLVIDSLHNTSLNQAFYGKTYLKTMQENFTALSSAF